MEITDVICPECGKAFLELRGDVELVCPVCGAVWRAAAE